MIVGIIGSRTRDSPRDLKILIDECLEIDKIEKITKIVTGDCQIGGDQFARDVLKSMFDCELDVKYKIDPKTGEKLEKYVSDYLEFTNICYTRNEKIAEEELGCLLALVAQNRKGGTENTIKHFKRLHKDWKKKLKIL